MSEALLGFSSAMPCDRRPILDFIVGAARSAGADAAAIVATAEAIPLDGGSCDARPTTRRTIR